jgi:hypothetical protein
MTNHIAKYYAFYTNTDSTISDTEDSFEVFAAFEGVPGATIITISILCFLLFYFPVFITSMSFVFTASAALPSFFEFLAVCLGSILSCFGLIIFPFMYLYPYVRFVYWVAIGFFRRFEETKSWRQHISYQLIGWTETVNNLFGKEYIWQNHQITFELASSESKQYLEDMFKIHFEKMHRKFYASDYYDPRQNWTFDPNTSTLSGTLNAEYLGVFHNFLKNDMTKPFVQLKNVAFAPKNEPYFLKKVQSESGGGGG